MYVWIRGKGMGRSKVFVVILLVIGEQQQTKFLHVVSVSSSSSRFTTEKRGSYGSPPPSIFSAPWVNILKITVIRKQKDTPHFVDHHYHAPAPLSLALFKTILVPSKPDEQIQDLNQEIQQLCISHQVFFPLHFLPGLIQEQFSVRFFLEISG